MSAETFAEAEAWVLESEAGRVLLEEAARVAEPGPSDLERWRRSAPPERVSAALRLSACRRRGVAKFGRAGGMWLEAEGLEQATAEPVARHKARRFSGGLVVDLCCGIGGDSLALAAESTTLAVDVDRTMCRRTRWNAEVYGVSASLAAVCSRAETFALPRGARVHVDPDRRARPGGRAVRVRDYVPGLDYLRGLPGRVPGGSLKLGPASDFAEHFGPLGFEIELVSLSGECKEATVWFGDLGSCRRRATVLPARASWTDRDGPRTAAPPVASPEAGWIYDPDPALVRSGLLEAFASAHSLGRCAPGIDFLTSDVALDSPFLSAFEVQEVLPFDLKALRRLVAREGLGTLEIKTRGLAVPPEQLRSRLRLEGPRSATLLLFGGGPARAVLARRKGLPPTGNAS